MKKLKVMTIVGTRPEIIRLSSIIKLMDRCFNHILVHTGQNWDYTLNEIFFKDLDIRAPDFYLNCSTDNLGGTIGKIIEQCYKTMDKLKPDALLILGDTNSCLCAISAKRLKIPVFHMEAGNRCFDENVPEELNRRIIDHISDINMAYTEHSRRNLINEGLKADHIYVTGSPLTEVLSTHMKNIEDSNILNEHGLLENQYFVISAHREENISNDINFFTIIETLNSIAEEYKHPLIFSTHPRSFKKIIDKKVKFHPLIRNIKPVGFFDYNKLQKYSFCVISDSGTLSEESSLLKFPAVLLRTSTERPEVLDKGSLILGSLCSDQVINSVNIVKQLFSKEKVIPCADYLDKNISVKVINIIQSFTKLIGGD